MSALYQLAVMGSPSDVQIAELEELISRAVGNFQLRLGHEIQWDVKPLAFNPSQQKSAAVVFFGGENAPLANIADLLHLGVPVLPVVSDVQNVGVEIPQLLQPLNCLAYNSGGSGRGLYIILCKRTIGRKLSPCPEPQ